ncbi:MAG: zinc metallopeptidase [Planctomycetota bacterium]|jgi:Zn-dependent membrane protease YugP
MFIFDPLFLIIVGPGMLFALWASARTKSAYHRYSRISARSRLTGAEVARRLLDADRLTDVSIERIPGQMTDHYDPRKKVLRLSEGVHDSTSLAAIGIAAHEMGHAIQDADAYKPLVARQAFAPVAMFASGAWVWLAILGFMLAANPVLGRGLMFGAIACLSAYALFALLTLPVEFDASRRALLILEDSRTLDAEELTGARKVLSAAALTYVASAVQAVLTVIWLVMRSQRR